MNKIKIDCPDCGKSVTSNNISKHLNSKSCDKEKSGKSLTIDESWKNQNGTYSCPHCNKEYSKNGIATHIWRNHSIGLNFTANNDGYKNDTKTIWNKGLSKESDSRVKQHAKTLSDDYKSGKLISSSKGRKHTPEEIENLRVKALASDHERIGRRTKTYVTVTGETIKFDSSWEVIVAKNLDNAGIEWIRPKPLKWICQKGLIHNYFSDFYIPAWNVYLDPKNDWVINNQAEKLNYLKANYNNIFILRENQLDVESIKHLIGLST